MFEFLQSISDFFTTGIYSWFEDAMTYMITTLLIWWIKAQIDSLVFAWEIARSVLESLNLLNQLNTAFALLPAQVSAAASFFRIPDALNILATALMTRFVLNTVPFI